jgi:hypothetical protein
MAAVIGAPAQAQELNFVGSTTGCFYQLGACVPGNSIGGLTFTGGGFDDYSDEDGYLPIGGDEWNNFGMFSLTNQSFDYNGWKFLLNVMFTSPPGVSTVNAATLEGIIKQSGNGLTVHFNTAPVSLTSLDGLTTFDLRINELGLTAGTANDPAVHYVNGNVTVTPEPATVGLMITGLIGLVPVAMRRRKQNGATK